MQLVVKNPLAMQGKPGSIPTVRKIPEEWLSVRILAYGQFYRQKEPGGL